MILDFPSGFYQTVIPPAPENRGNVTYTISNEEPPRGALFFLKIANNLLAASPSLIASEPQGDVQSSTLRSFRNQTVIGTPSFPIGAILDFNEPFKELDAQSASLNVNVDFPRYKADDTDPVNGKLIQAYETYQDRLLKVAQSSLSKQAEIENIERSINTMLSSLEATREALKIMENDSDLLAIEESLNAKIAASETKIDELTVEIEVLDQQRVELTDSINRLAKVIS